MVRFRGAFASLAFLAAFLVMSTSAWAGPQWCEEDPVFVVNGALVDVTTRFPGAYASTTSSVHYDMQVPSNVLAAVVSLPGTVPVTASVSRTLPPYYGLLSIPVVVTVTMKTSSTYQHYTSITGLGRTIVGGVDGWSNKPMRAKFYMYGL